ncbi:ATP-binding cassette domain-containing protein [Mesorhizobium sp. B2-4-9]|uniref:ATP-binding cassette domain-containing protein n=1 Tax=Mesorhizobium sp. B2-4-9 TaxID=2589940 RepID=UPI00112976EE|nr:ATP-binding cassette domain-containing protein [Mesorhizobium sp. B2-4-9]TPL21083.1 ATP-binding cassette domain-containing protein [Mesorhizobium sp. B2-4-9]
MASQYHALSRNVPDADRLESLLTLSSVCKFFPGVRALNDVTFDVLAGEVHGLVGENGAGKSTLMAVASGALRADAGSVTIAGVTVEDDPRRARELGLAIVRQEPSLMPDLTVAENLFLGLPENLRPSLFGVGAWANGLLGRWSSALSFEANDRVAQLNPEQRFIVEIVKALASEPKVLVLDEPTEHLGAENVERLFTRIQEVTGRGACVVYISHRIREVQKIANRLTVLRDGEGQGTFVAQDLREDEIVTLIVGGEIDREFPEKMAQPSGTKVLAVVGLTGKGFSNVNLGVGRGEIVGLAGIDGNGQRDFLRALAGLQFATGKVTIDGASASIAGPKAAAANGIRYLPGDRHREGIFPDLSVRENFSVRSIGADIRYGAVSTQLEQKRAKAAIAKFAVKTPHTETPIRLLSGGNQQKLVLASVLASNPRVILIDEPTQGVDVGARAEIYTIIRDIAGAGCAVILLSSDAQEVAGLSDRVLVFSRGQIVETLAGEEVIESNITSAVLKSTSTRERSAHSTKRFWAWAAGDSAPLVMVAVAIIALGAVAALANPFYLTPRSLGSLMTLAATLALVAYAQQTVMLVGGIDLSVGPLMGLVQVVGSFYFLKDLPPDQYVLGFALILVVAVAVGLTNWALVEPLGLHPMVATLATFMALQAVSLLLRPVPGGMFASGIVGVINYRHWGIPVTIVVAFMIGLALELALYKGRLGVSFRGLGSSAEVARIAGVRPWWTRLLAYVGSSVMAGLAAITLMPQIGIGDPRAGLGYTLTSIAAAVIGGASLFGGRGSFLGALLGAIFITQINSVTAFLALDQAWQSYLLGGMIIAAVALYSKSRQIAVAA